MRQLLEWSAWPMQTPAPYGLFHILCAACGIAAALAAAYLLRNLSGKHSRRLIFAAGVVLLCAELYKQLFHTFVLCDGAYNWWYFPFQLCSIPMFLCLIAPWLPNGGKAQKTVYVFLCSFSLLGGFVVFIDPSGMFYSYWSLTLHSLVWHVLLVFVGAFVGFSGLGVAKTGAFARAGALYLILCAVALCLNFLFWDAANGNINLFYLGPMPSKQLVFRDITAALGWQANAGIYMAGTIFGAFLLYRAFSVYRARQQNKTKRQQQGSS